MTSEITDKNRTAETRAVLTVESVLARPELLYSPETADIYPTLVPGQLPLKTRQPGDADFWRRFGGLGSVEKLFLKNHLGQAPSGERQSASGLVLKRPLQQQEISNAYPEGYLGSVTYEYLNSEDLAGLMPWLQVDQDTGSLVLELPENENDFVQMITAVSNGLIQDPIQISTGQLVCFSTSGRLINEVLISNYVSTGLKKMQPELANKIVPGKSLILKPTPMGGGRFVWLANGIFPQFGEGESVGDLMKAPEFIGSPTQWEIIQQMEDMNHVVRAMKQLWINITHRDIKHSNLLYDRETGRIALSDFGVALASDITHSSELKGTLLQLPPEAIQQVVIGSHELAKGPQTDDYALTLDLLRLITGVNPRRVENNTQDGLGYFSSLLRSELNSEFSKALKSFFDTHFRKSSAIGAKNVKEHITDRGVATLTKLAELAIGKDIELRPLALVTTTLYTSVIDSIDKTEDLTATLSLIEFLIDNRNLAEKAHSTRLLLSHALAKSEYTAKYFNLASRLSQNPEFVYRMCKKLGVETPELPELKARSQLKVRQVRALIAAVIETPSSYYSRLHHAFADFHDNALPNFAFK